MLEFHSRLSALALRALLAVTVLCTSALASAQTAGKTEVLWLGQSTTRITTPGGKVIVIDPWLTSNPKTPANFKALTALGKVDLVLVTHAHFDHVADAPALAKMHNVPVYGPAGLNDTWGKLGVLPPDLSPRFGKGGTITPFGPNGPKITAVHAEHSSEFAGRIPQRNKDELHIGGEPVGYILEMENGFKIWHMGDTAVFGDMRLIADMYQPDLVLLPIGGHFVMNPQDAAMAMREMIRPEVRVADPLRHHPAIARNAGRIQGGAGSQPGADAGGESRGKGGVLTAAPAAAGRMAKSRR